jgi:hypothetical protein
LLETEKRQTAFEIGLGQVCTAAADIGKHCDCCIDPTSPCYCNCVLSVANHAGLSRCSAMESGRGKADVKGSSLHVGHPGHVDKLPSSCSLEAASACPALPPVADSRASPTARKASASQPGSPSPSGRPYQRSKGSGCC